MKPDWKIETLIFIGNRKNILMNRFMSWHMWIKEVFNNNMVMTYISLNDSQRFKKSEFFVKLYDDQFSKL